MPLTEAQVQSVLKSLVDPNTGKDFVTTRAARNIKVAGDEVSLDIELGYPGKSQHEPIRRQVTQALKDAGAAAAKGKASSKGGAPAGRRGARLVPCLQNLTPAAPSK